MKNLTKILQITLISLTLILSVACSTQTRTNNWEPDSTELTNSLTTFFQEVEKSDNSNLVQTTKNSLLFENDAAKAAAVNNPPQVVYYAESGKTGLPLSVAGILDFSILGLPTASLYDLVEAKVILVDNYVSINREFTLIVSVKFIEPDGSVGANQAVSFKTGNYSFADDKLVLSFEKFDLVSFDLAEDVEEDLAPVVQMQVLDKSGVEYGQFSSLIGFGF